MSYKTWLNSIVDDHKLDRSHVFEIDHEGTPHFMDFDTLIESIIALPTRLQKKIKKIILVIDSQNGDIMPYFSHIAEGFIISKLHEVDTENI